MRLQALLAVAATCLAVAGALAPAASAQSTRTWVSGVGDDANPCSRTAPCKTFAGAISKTAAGGEINALDSGGFGNVTITKAITIDATSVLGGLLNSSVDGVIVNAAATDDVVLRGLVIDGAHDTSAGAPPCKFNGESGVRILRARSVRIEDSKILRQQMSVEIGPSNPVNVFVNRVDMSESCTHGVVYVPGSAGTANVTIQDSTFSNTGIALSMSTGGSAWLTRSTLFANALGLQALGTGTINDYGDNRLIANAADGAATKNLATSLLGSPGATGPQGPTGPTGPKGDPAIKLLVAAASSSLTGKAGKSVALNYAATAAGASTLTVKKGSKTFGTVRAKARAGKNTISFKAAKKGSYKLTLRVIGADGQVDTDTATVKLR